MERKVNRYFLLASLLSLLMSSPARADSSPTTPTCTESPNEQALLACRQKAFAAATSRLNAAVEKLKQR